MKTHRPRWNIYDGKVIYSAPVLGRTGFWANFYARALHQLPRARPYWFWTGYADQLSIVAQGWKQRHSILVSQINRNNCGRYAWLKRTRKEPWKYQQIKMTSSEGLKKRIDAQCKPTAHFCSWLETAALIFSQKFLISKRLFWLISMEINCCTRSHCLLGW